MEVCKFVQISLGNTYMNDGGMNSSVNSYENSETVKFNMWTSSPSHLGGSLSPSGGSDIDEDSRINKDDQYKVQKYRFFYTNVKYVLLHSYET